MLFSILQLFNLYVNGKVLYNFKGQHLENELSYIFQAIGNVFNLQQKQ